MPPVIEAETASIAASPAGAANALRTGEITFESDSASERKNKAAAPATDGQESLFERFAWVYILFREKCFRDDTERFLHALWPDGPPASGTRLLELGCGPGFYSCRVANRHPTISVLGIDRSARQLDWARTKAREAALQNCRFHRDNVLNLSHPDDSFDALIAARLFTVLPDPERGIAEMHRVLRPGGRCIVAEPRYALWASLPLFAMWVLARFTRVRNGYREPARATVLSPASFESLFATQPWARVQVWQDGRYQYALCEKR